MFAARTTAVAFADSAAATFSDSYPFSFSCSDKDNAACVAAAGGSRSLSTSPIATVPAAPTPACVIRYHQPSFSSNDCAACVARSSNPFRLSKWKHQLQLSTSGFDNNGDDGVARRPSLDRVPVRQYPAQATRGIRLVSAVQTPASAEAACLRQPALQHQQHGGNINFGGRQNQQRSLIPALQHLHQQQCRHAA